MHTLLDSPHIADLALGTLGKSEIEGTAVIIAGRQTLKPLAQLATPLANEALRLRHGCIQYACRSLR
jgi:hypothetical protein